MPALLLYLLQANAALLLFAAAYYLALRRLTFFALNRAYLLFALGFAALYPALDWAALLPREAALLPTGLRVVGATWPLPTAGPAPAPLFIWDWLLALYAVGAATMLVRLLGQLLSWYRLHRAARPATVAGYRVRRLAAAASPFSFWQTIYVRPEQHAPAELRLILRHEQVHVRQWHSLDVLLAQLVRVACWFNPGAWGLLRAVRENLEFVADEQVLRAGADRRGYQYSLLHSNTDAPGLPVVNNFHFTPLKTRITMMNKKKSAAAHRLTYALLVPALMLTAIGCGKSPVEPSAAPPDTTFALATSQQDAKTDTQLPDNMLYFVDGQEADKSALATMDPQTIDAVNVLKGADFQQKFHSQAAGAILIITRQNKDSEAVRAFNAKYGITYKAAQKAEKLQVPPNALILLDGQEATSQTLEQLAPDAIEKVTVFKGADAKSRYGAKGKNGVLVVMTKK